MDYDSVSFPEHLVKNIELIDQNPIQLLIKILTL
jgi:hypothetical protein